MKINPIITGATGMVGKGVLLECLESPEVGSVLIINRHPVDIEHEKLKEIILRDFFDLSRIQDELRGYNACFFCLGISSLGISKEDYHRITYELTMHFANTLVKINPDMTFCYVSGTGTDSTESSRQNWTNVKGKTENAILDLPFKAKYMFRPGIIKPMKGARSKTGWVNTLITIFGPLFYLMEKASPKYVTTTVNVGKAMINAVKMGYEKTHLENEDINKLAAQGAGRLS